MFILWVWRLFVCPPDWILVVVPVNVALINCSFLSPFYQVFNSLDLCDFLLSHLLEEHFSLELIFLSLGGVEVFYFFSLSCFSNLEGSSFARRFKTIITTE
jgi:hypothetical protein